MRIYRLLSVVALTAGLALTAVPALVSADKGGADRPFSASGSGVTTNPGTPGCQFTAAGCTTTSAGTLQGSHIGRSTFTSTSTILWASATSNGQGGFCAPASSSTLITAANGDQISLQGSGTVCEVGKTGVNVPHTFDGTFAVTGGTGRFANASGKGTFAVSEDAGAFTVQYGGSLSY